MKLQDLLLRSAAARPHAQAVGGPTGSATYRELDRLAALVAGRLQALGVAPGDRVALWLDKGVPAIAAMQAVLRLGAAYVPIDPASPPARARRILSDCAPAALVVDAGHADGAGLPTLVVDSEEWRAMLTGPVPPPPSPSGDAGELAYILYTSGSTGTPKGVCISHRNVLAFVEWAAGAVGATAADRFANHAPFHFDLSVFDLYVAFAAGGCVVPVPTALAYAPRRLVEFLRRERISVWYSVPSALTLMADHGGLLEAPSAEPRVAVFAGEPFPIAALRRLREAWPEARLFNFYGPTETNVCTAHEVGRIPADRVAPVPIGRAASGDRVWLETEGGDLASAGEAGELVVSGPTVMLGYWGRGPQGDAPYRTGDLARRNADGELEFLGRRDGQVKLRGHRVELGEIESVLTNLAGVREAAVTVQGDGREARLLAVLAGDARDRPGLLAVKRQCAEHLPRSMIVDRVRWVEALPRNGNGKLDRRRLAGAVD